MDSELVHNLIKFNPDLKCAHLAYIKFPDLHFNVMPKLTDISIFQCQGGIGIRSLLSKATNLKTLKLSDMDGEISSYVNQTSDKLRSLDIVGYFRPIELDSKITASLANLRELKLERCIGEVSSLLTQAAPNISKLKLENIDLDVTVDAPFSNLKSVFINHKTLVQGKELRTCALVARGGRLREFIIPPPVTEADKDVDVLILYDSQLKVREKKKKKVKE